MRGLARIVFVFSIALFGALLPIGAAAQTGSSLELYTDFPSLVIGSGVTSDILLTMRGGARPQIVDLQMEEIPANWTATFRGGENVVNSVYIQASSAATVTLRLEPPAETTGGTYDFVVLARSETAVARLPLRLTVTERTPPSLRWEVELPIIRGRPSSIFRYSAKLYNEGGENITANVLTDAPTGFKVTVELGISEVTSVPLDANSYKSLSIKVEPFMTDMEAGRYPVQVLAFAGEAQDRLTVVAEVTGEPALTVTAPDGRLSADAYAGKETPVKVLLRNTGTAAAEGIDLSSSEPSGWSVKFEPLQIARLEPGTEVEVMARITPADQALTGDYIVTVRAKPETVGEKSAEFRITVLTSTLWGLVGVAVIAVAVGVVGLAVMRFGRR